MTKSTITRERLQEIAEDGFLKHGESKELARMALAAMDSEPVAYMYRQVQELRNRFRTCDEWEINCRLVESDFPAVEIPESEDYEFLPLYRHAQPAPISEQVLPLQDKDLQGVIDALEHPAGINAAGKQVVRLSLVELQERRKADREPVVKKVACWSCQNEVEIAAISDCDGCCPKCGTRIHLDEEPYIAPLSAPDRDQVRQEHAEWSQATFGNVGPVGPLKHLSKEALEAAAEPGDLSEWADMQFLLWDAQRRAGITDEQITQAMIDKLAVNKQREWPEPKDGEPRLHIKEQPAPVAPVVPDFKKLARELVDNLVDCG